MIPGVDLRKKFGFLATEWTKDTRIVVVDMAEQNISVVVDAVTEVLLPTADSVEPPSSVIATTDWEYLLGIAKLESWLIILLDLEQTLSAVELAKLSDVSIRKATGGVLMNRKTSLQREPQPKKRPSGRVSGRRTYEKRVY